MKAKPTNDEDSPDPVTVTPKRLADQLHRLGEDLMRSMLRLRTIKPYLGPNVLEAPHKLIADAVAQVVDLGAAVRAGQVPIIAGLDLAAGRGMRPLLDRIEQSTSDPARSNVNGTSAALDERPRSQGRREKREAKKKGKAPAETTPPLEAALPAEGKTRRPPRFQWLCAVRDDSGRSVALEPLLLETTDPAEARKLAEAAYVGTGYRGGHDGSVIHRVTAASLICERVTNKAMTVTPENFCMLHGGEAIPAGHDRIFEVYDGREKPKKRLGEVAGANVIRAALAAEVRWPEVPKRLLDLRPKLVPGSKRQATQPSSSSSTRPPAVKDADCELAEFRAGFEAEGEQARVAVEARAPDPPKRRGRPSRRQPAVPS